jgi:hypothetical protein
MSRSRRKLDTTPISYEEVVDSPALQGMVSFLQVEPGKLPQLDFRPVSPQTGIPEATIPESVSSPEAALPPTPADSGAPTSATPETAPPLTGTTLAGVPDSGIPETTPPPFAPPLGISPKPRIRRALLLSDGHSYGEQALYDALWTHAQPSDHPHTRLITIGYRTMSELARLTVNNCKANIQALAAKLAVEEVASYSHSQGRTYRIYSPEATLQRRQAAGLTHIIKTRGVQFVHPDTGIPVSAVLPTGAPE